MQLEAHIYDLELKGKYRMCNMDQPSSKSERLSPMCSHT